MYAPPSTPHLTGSFSWLTVGVCVRVRALSVPFPSTALQHLSVGTRPDLARARNSGIPLNDQLWEMGLRPVGTPR